MNCPNVQNLMYEVERKIDVEWARAVNETFPVRVVVHTDDRPGMLNQLTSVLVAEQSNIRSSGGEFGRQARRRWRGHRHDGRDSRQEAAGARGGRDPPHLGRPRRGANAMIETQAEPEHIAISKSKGIQIDWKDGHHSQYTLAYLRDECPCASCTGAHGTEPQKTNYSALPASPFQMYTAYAQDAERRAGGPLRDPHRVERRPQHRHLFVRSSAQDLPLRDL